VRVYSTEQQHHALRIASSRELNNAEASALIRSVEAYRDAEEVIAQLRSDLSTVTVRAAELLAAERLAHAETRKALERQDRAVLSMNAALESTRAELAKAEVYRVQAEARVKKLEEILDTEAIRHDDLG
jgi:hypothetical protein